jgi:hypothetical protein
MSAGRTQPSIHLVGDEFNETRGLQIMMAFNPAHADRLFEGTGHTQAELFRTRKGSQGAAALRPVGQHSCHDAHAEEAA